MNLFIVSRRECYCENLAAEEDVVEKMRTGPIEIDIAGPMTFWLIFLIFGVIIELILVPIFGSAPYGSANIGNLITSIGRWIIYLPGSLILPLIVALWLGEMVGSMRSRVGTAAYVGLINALYAALIYVIAIFIIYLLLFYISPKSLTSITLTYFATYSVLVPVVILLVLIPLISALSAARHGGA